VELPLEEGIPIGGGGGAGEEGIPIGGGIWEAYAELFALPASSTGHGEVDVPAADGGRGVGAIEPSAGSSPRGEEAVASVWPRAKFE